jgi:hypothetical protein
MAKALFIIVSCRFGVPRDLHGDQSRNFESHLVQMFFNACE